MRIKLLATNWPFKTHTNNVYFHLSLANLCVIVSDNEQISLICNDFQIFLP